MTNRKAQVIRVRGRPIHPLNSGVCAMHYGLHSAVGIPLQAATPRTRDTMRSDVTGNIDREARDRYRFFVEFRDTIPIVVSIQ